jgi:cephalosporin hydroxylase
MFNSENITRKSDLSNNDSLSMYLNHACQQNHNAFEVFYNFLTEIKPKRILEIGTALGGFTSFLKIVSDENNLDISILSYDIYRREWYDEMIESGIDVRVEDVFSDNYQSVKQEVIEFIQSEGTTIVLCDGGNKISEFNLLSNYLKKDDYILAHDYVHDTEKFEREINNKIWNWCEITENDIMESCEINNLLDYNPEIFASVVWACKQKK